jgi:hypothetical protein
MGREEEVAVRPRNRRDHGILDDQRTALGDLDPLVHVRAGILPAHDVLRRREEQHHAGRRDEHGHHRPRSGARGRSAIEERAACGDGHEDRDHRVDGEQEAEAVQAGGGERDHEGA